MATLALMLLGMALSPLLKVKLLPDRSLPSVTVSYSYDGANAVVADSEVTSRLEAVFSNLEGLVNMRSRTADESGDITLEMQKGADMDAVRFEVSMLIRQVCPELPAGVNYPQIQVSRPDVEERVEQFISIVLNSPTGNFYKDEFSFIALGDAYKTLNQPREAETQYQLAANMVPHKFYPLYLLATLYNETGQQKKAVALARQLLNKDVKVPSKAIEEIKEEMREVINSNSFSSDEIHEEIKKGKIYTKFSSILIKQQFW